MSLERGADLGHTQADDGRRSLRVERRCHEKGGPGGEKRTRGLAASYRILFQNRRGAGEIRRCRCHGQALRENDIPPSARVFRYTSY